MHRCWCPGINLVIIHGHPLCSCPGSSPGVSLDLAVETNEDLKLPSQFSSVQSLSHVQLFDTPRTVACQAPLSMGFFRQEYWSGLFPSPSYELR